jgi:hypothetical protein
MFELRRYRFMLPRSLPVPNPASSGKTARQSYQTFDRGAKPVCVANRHLRVALNACIGRD